MPGYIAKAAFAWDVAGNVVGGGRGAADMLENGPNAGNLSQVFFAGMGITGNMAGLVRAKAAAAPNNLSSASDAVRHRVLSNIAESKAARLSQGGIDEVASLKSIRRYTERLVKGSAVSANPAFMRQVRAINRRINLEQYGAAGSRYHKLNFDIVKEAKENGHFRSLNVDMSIDIPSGGILPIRRPDYRFDLGGIYDLKAFRPRVNAYDATPQFQDIQLATGQLPIPLYYRLW